MQTPLKPTIPLRRVRIRDIAKFVGVSVMTVSLSLRKHPKISEPTRKRVERAARELGYTPEPEMVSLMTRLHRSRQLQYAPRMAIVDPSSVRSLLEPDNYCARVCVGATARAESLGYVPTHFSRFAYDGDDSRLLREIRARGIRGVLLLPPTKPVTLKPNLDWSSLSVIAATHAITPTQFHQVVPHQFMDMCQLIRQLEEEGHRRIGAVFETDFEDRIHHQFTAAFALHNHGERLLRVPNHRKLDGNHVQKWMAATRPDVVISPFATDLKRSFDAVSDSSFPRPRLISLGATSDPDIPCWDERPEVIGADAAILLAGMIQNNETGVPKSVRTNMIHGVFHNVRPQRHLLAR